MLTTPRLIIFNSSVDATDSIVFSFSSKGGDMVYANELEIYNIDTNEEIYSSKTDTFQFKHTIQANVLENGLSYKVRIRTYNQKSEYSQWSDFIFLKCLSPPNITFINLDDGQVDAQSYKFIGKYSQDQNDELKSYRFILYDFQKKQIETSNEIFTEPIEYEFSNLNNDTIYYVEIKVKSVNDGYGSTGLVPIYVKYIIPRMSNILNLENNYENACVDIEIKAIQVIFKLLDGEYDYIDDEWININGCIYTDRELGFYLDSEEWSLNLRFKLLDNSSEILKVFGENDDYFTVEKWKDRLFLRYYKNDLIIMNRWYDISQINDETINLWIGKNNNGISDRMTIL